MIHKSLWGGCDLGARVETWLLGVRVSVSVSLCWNPDVRFQFWFGFTAVEKSVSVSVSVLLRRDFGFWVSVSVKFHPRKLFYCEYGLFKSSTSWRFCFITTISSSSDGRVRRAIASEVVDLGMIPSPVKPKTQKLLFTASLYSTLSVKGIAPVRMVMTIFKTQNHRKFWTGFSFSFGFDVLRKNGLGSSLGFQNFGWVGVSFSLGFQNIL